MLVDLGSDRVKGNVKGMSQEPTFVAFDPNRIALIGGTSNQQMVLVPYCEHTYKGWGLDTYERLIHVRFIQPP